MEKKKIKSTQGLPLATAIDVLFFKVFHNLLGPAPATSALHGLDPIRSAHSPRSSYYFPLYGDVWEVGKDCIEMEEI